MTYQAPYAARYVSAAGNQIQLLNLWDDTPEPPRFGGSMEAFETSLVDGPRAFAQGLGSAVEQRTVAFYRWFVDYQDMATYQENIALWLASNQNGYLYLQFAEQPQWRFAAVITGYQFETENFVPPPSPEDGYLCLLVTLTMTVTDRTPDNSNWVFDVTPASVSAPASGGQYTFSVASYFSPGNGQNTVGQGWQAVPGDGVTVSNVVNGNNGSFRATVSTNETTEERSLYVTVIQDGTGLSKLAEIIQEANAPQEKTVGSPIFMQGNSSAIAALGKMNWQQFRLSWGEQMAEIPPSPVSIKSVTVPRGNSNEINTTLSIYALNADGSGTTLLGTSAAAVNMGDSEGAWRATFAFETPVQVNPNQKLIFQPGTAIYTSIETVTPYEWGGLSFRPYPEAITVTDHMAAMSLDIEYIG